MVNLLRPHFKNLIGINHFAKITLVSDAAPLTDQTFSVGTEAAVKIIKHYYENDYNIMNVAPDTDLIKRGFCLDDSDKLPFLYRTDALRLFNI